MVRITKETKTDPSPIRGRKHNILYDEEGDPLADTASHILKIFVHSNRGKYIGHQMVMFPVELRYHDLEHLIDKGR
jgi:hypothetical protein